MADETPVTPEPGAEKKKRGKRGKAAGGLDAKVIEMAADAIATSKEAVQALKDQIPRVRSHELTVTEADTLRCDKCGQPGLRCKGEHAVIDIVPNDLWAKAWQGYNLNGVLYDGPKVTVPADAAQEILSCLNNWQRNEAERMLPKDQIKRHRDNANRNIATLSGR